MTFLYSHYYNFQPSGSDPTLGQWNFKDWCFLNFEVFNLKGCKVSIHLVGPSLLLKTESTRTSCSSSHNTSTAFSLLGSWELRAWMKSQPREGWGRLTYCPQHTLQCDLWRHAHWEKISPLSCLKNITRRLVPVEDHSRETGLGKDHFPSVELFGGPQASTFLPCIEQLSTLHVPHSHPTGQTKHRGSREGERWLRVGRAEGQGTKQATGSGESSSNPH